jgi:hypothetical protein
MHVDVTELFLRQRRPPEGLTDIAIEFVIRFEGIEQDAVAIVNDAFDLPQ